jgi:hypothetical protein
MIGAATFDKDDNSLPDGLDGEEEEEEEESEELDEEVAQATNYAAGSRARAPSRATASTFVFVLTEAGLATTTAGVLIDSFVHTICKA